MNQRFKILILTSSYPLYNGDNNGVFIHELAKRFTREYDTYVLAPYKKGVLKSESIDDVIIDRFYQFPFRLFEIAYGTDIMVKIKRNIFYILIVPFFVTMQLIALVKLVKKAKIDLIHAHWIIPQGFVAVLYKLLFNSKIPIIITIHGGDYNNFKGRMWKPILAFILKNANKVIVVSEDLRENLLSSGYNNNVEVCPMGVDTDLFHPKHKDNLLKQQYDINGHFLLFVGSLIERKGIRYLINAMPDVIESLHDVKLIIIGDGILKEELVKTTNDLKLSNKIRFLGNIPNNELPKYFATADLFILPSLSEGWPVVVMESLSCGCNALVSDLPIFTKYLTDCEFVKVCRKTDTENISRTICLALQSPSMKDGDRLKAREYAKKHFDWEVITKRHLTIFSKTFSKNEVY